MTKSPTPITLLMADDDPDDCLLTRDALAESRLLNGLHFVHDGEQLLDYLRREGKYLTSPRPQLILLDLNMPRKDGREALREIKADPQLRSIPIVILTTSKAEEDILRSYDLGASAFITKPVTFEGLVEAMKTLGRYWFEIVELPPNKEGRQTMSSETTFIALIEDDEDDYVLTRDLLDEIQQGRFELKWVSTYDEALTMMRSPGVDVYLIDYRLGRNNGLDLLREAILQGVRAPIILLTGQGNREVDVEAMQSGAADYLVKGEINSYLLERAIRYAIEHKRAEESIRHHMAQTEALARTAAHLSTQLNLDSVLHIICEETAYAAGVPAVGVGLYDANTDLIHYRACVGLPHEFLQEAQPFPRDVFHQLAREFTNLIAIPDIQAISDLPNASLFARYDIHSLCDISLVRGSQIVGVLTAFVIGHPHAFTVDEQILLKGIADQAVQAISNARLYEDSRRHAARAESLARTAARLNSQLELDAILNAVCEETARALTVPVVAVSLYDSKQNHLHFAATYGLPDDFKEQIRPFPRTLLDQYTSGATSTVVVSHLEAHPELPNYEVLMRYNLGGFCAAGMTRNEDLIGALFVCTQGQPCDFTDDEQALLQGLADQAAQAIVNARLFAETQRRLNNVQALRAIDNAITSSLDMRLTLNVVLEQVIDQLHVDAVALYIFREHSKILEYAAGRGFRTNRLARSHLLLGDNYAGRAALERRTVHVLELPKVSADFKRSHLIADENFVSYFAVPLLAKGNIKGVLEIFQRSPLVVDSEWRDFLETLAGQAAIAIDNATLFNDLQRSNFELTIAYDSTIEGWSRALDLRDKETEGHTQRVTEKTVKLARAMGIPENEVIHIRRGALLHDMGKLGVPDSILLKPGPLTDEEWAIMRKHPAYAYEMLSPITYLQRALDIPYCHHEKWNGTGYPRGLEGEQIPLAARLFAVVDVWDALSSDRPYRSAWAPDKVREHILASNGTHFDPKVVEVFMAML